MNVLLIPGCPVKRRHVFWRITFHLHQQEASSQSHSQEKFHEFSGELLNYLSKFFLLNVAIDSPKEIPSVIFDPPL